MADDPKTRTSTSSIQEGITMALSTTIEKTRKDVEKALADPTFLYVVAGAGDLAVEKARAAGSDIAARAAAFDAKAFRDQAQARGAELQAKLSARVGTLPDDVKAAPEQAQVKATELQAKASELQARIVARVNSMQDVKVGPEQAQAKASELQAKAESVVTDVVTAALVAYGELAGRGKQLVTRVRSQEATTDLETQVDATVSKVKAAKTTAKKSVKKTATSAKATKTTAKKSATATKKAVKSAGTSAKKSAEAAATAVEATAEKIGD